MYTVSRSDGTTGNGVELPHFMETLDAHISPRMFKPDEAAVTQHRDKLKGVIESQRNVLDKAKSEVERGKEVAHEIGWNVSTFKRHLADYARSRDREDKARKTSRYGYVDAEIENATKRKKEIMLAMQEVATKIVASIEKLRLGVFLSERELLRCNNPDDVDTLLKAKHILDSNGNVSIKDVHADVNAAHKGLENAQQALADFDANFEKQWQKVAEESRYAVTAVRGSKEPERKTR